MNENEMELIELNYKSPYTEICPCGCGAVISKKIVNVWNNDGKPFPFKIESTTIKARPSFSPMLGKYLD